MTDIEWTHGEGYKGETWNPLVGCSIVSPGCKNCYAMNWAFRMERMTKAPEQYKGTTHEVNGRKVWTGKVNVAPLKKVEEPLRWTKPRMIFVNSMSDLFHEDVPYQTIDAVMEIMGACEQHVFQVLTKRSGRMHEYLNSERAKVAWNARRLDREAWPARNVWWGVSVERQEEADKRVPYLLASPAAVRFISAEPLLGDVNIRRWLASRTISNIKKSGIDWVIVGGESGDGARPMHPDWARSLRDQCFEAGVPFFFKQFGQHQYRHCGSFSEEPANEGPEPDWWPVGDFAVDPDGRVGRPADVHPRVALAKRMGSKHWDGYDVLDGKTHKMMPKVSVTA